ncbi:MAG: biotin--[acetyl-CoA-carboxylase] ligase, partial [Gammaproteobacteria bacterium]
HTCSGSTSGTARGVNEKGALLLEVGGRLHTIIAGDVSLRAVQ